jgi:RimJ/RimL family protein N-acetyltransferase
MSEHHARDILMWHYDDQYAFYNANPTEIESDVANFLDPQNSYHSISLDGELIGFFCLGPDAQVGGGDYTSEDALDVGLGLRPDLTGRGMGREVLMGVLEYARGQYAPRLFRTTVAGFNHRALRLCESVGFRPQHTFAGSTRHGEMEFLQMVKVARVE